MRVAIFGASGFVGSALAEELWGDGDCEVRPVIHSSGNAARLARFGQPMVQADLMVPPSLDHALAGCSHVVNCSRGGAEVMIAGLQNLLEAAQRAGVRRFVHLSSVAAYGDLTDVPVITEEMPARPARGTYGAVKLRQDELVAKAARKGLSAFIICPPNISGAYSPFLLEIIDTIRRGRLALVDDGSQPCELIDVANLVWAIRLALAADASDTQRIFVTDGVPTTWRDVANALQQFADIEEPVPSISMTDARALVARSEARPPSIRGAMKHVFSPVVRDALKRDPWFAEVEKTLKTTIKRVPALERSLRRRFAQRPRVERVTQPPFSDRLIRQQLRGITYSQERARRTLGYQPRLTGSARMRVFSEWYRVHYGWSDEWWPLLSVMAKGA